MKAGFFRMTRFVLSVLLVVGLLAAAGEGKQQAGDEQTKSEVKIASPVPPSEAATLVFNNRKIVTFRAKLYGTVTPADRVENVLKRINDAVEAGRDEEVAVAMADNGMVITIGERGVMVLTSADLDPEQEETLAHLAAQTVSNLSLALAEHHEIYDIPRLLKSIGYAVAATLIYVLILLLIRKMRFWLRGAMGRIADKKMDQVVLIERKVGAGSLVFTRERLRIISARLIDALALALALLLGYGWLTFCLTRFPFTRPWGESLGSNLFSAVREVAGMFVGAVPGLLTVAIIVVITRGISRFVTGLFNAVEQRKVLLVGIHPETAPATRRIVNVVLWLLAVVMAYPYMPGSGSEAFKGISVFVGLVVSLGSTGIVNQAMSGLILIYSLALKPGDYVRINDTEGVVVYLGFLSTKIRNVLNEEITLPNAVIVGTTIKNFTRLHSEGGVFMNTTVTIGYDTPWRQVHAMLLLAAGRTGGVRREPPSFVLQKALSDYYVEYALCFSIERPEERIPVLSELHQHIQDAFNEYGVQIMSPHFMADKAEKVWVPKERWFEPPADPHSGKGESGRMS